MARRIPNDPWVDRLENALGVAREGSDPEGVHEIRVSTRRLITWLDLGGIEKGQAELRWLRNACERVRDLDVQLGRDVPKPMKKWLRKEWKAARPDLLGALDSPAVPRLFGTLRGMKGIRYRDAEAGLSRMVDRAMKAGAVVEQGSTDGEDLHRVRRRIRPIRYALEWMDRPSGRVKTAQDVLGEMNDAEVAYHMVKEWGGDDKHIKRLRKHRDHLMVEAAASWPELKRVLLGLG